MTSAAGNENDPPVWLLGGRGDVGGRLAALLAEDLCQRVVLCGRDGDAAAAVARKIGNAVTAIGLDSSDPSLAEMVPARASLVNLTEATHPAFAARCIETGGVFIESSASPEYVGLVSDATTSSQSGLAVMNAGLMPGLTNICARRLKSSLADILEIDIVIEMGLGRHHGPSATRWTIASLGKSYDTIIDGNRQTLPAGRLYRDIRFSGDDRSRVALGFPFSDQFSIAGLGILTARSFLALDPPWVTHLLYHAARLGLGKGMQRLSGRIQWLLDHMPVVGRIGTRLIVEGRGTGPTDISCIEIHTGDQADVTAVMLHETLLAARRTEMRGSIDSDRLVGVEDALTAIRHRLPETRVFQTSQLRNLSFSEKDFA